MKHLRTLFVLAFASALATSAAFAEGDKKPAEKSDKACGSCCCSCKDKKADETKTEKKDK